jgi:undecaprenyl pyrophosphate synthase
MGFQYCTVWLISTKNLYERPNDEVIAVFDAIVRCIVRQSLCEWRTEERILINIIGEWREILHSRNISHVLRGNPVSPKRSREIIFDGNRVLTFLAGFDGPKETYQALRAIARHDSNITELPDLDLGIDGLPKPDLWIRTGDQTERLIKNEKSSYLAVPTYWPDMNANRFEHCVRTAVTLSSKRK